MKNPNLRKVAMPGSIDKKSCLTPFSCDGVTKDIELAGTQFVGGVMTTGQNGAEGSFYANKGVTQGIAAGADEIASVTVIIQVSANICFTQAVTLGEVQLLFDLPNGGQATAQIFRTLEADAREVINNRRIDCSNIGVLNSYIH
jgi:hypothetical protein